MNHYPVPGQTTDKTTVQPKTAGRNLFARIVHLLPTLLVLTALAGIGFWGHHTGWHVNSFDELINGKAEHAYDAQWCEEHKVAEESCVACQVEMPLEKDYGWCKVHGVHQCPLEHPDVAQIENPNVTAEDFARAERALAIRERKENSEFCKNYQRQIQFASLQSVQKAGIDVDLAQRHSVTEFITANGIVTYDQTRLAHLASRAEGTVWQVYKAIGDVVKKGDVLALVDAASVGQTKSELLDAIAAEYLSKEMLDRMEPLVARGAVSATQILETRTQYQQAQIRVTKAHQSLVNLGLNVSLESLSGLETDEQIEKLRYLGIPGELLQELDPGQRTSNLIPVRASLDGVVIDRDLVNGEVVDTRQVLFQLADTSVMWVTFHVPAEEVAYVAPGQQVRFQPEGAQKEVTGEISWISTSMEAKTRTVTVRADLANAAGKLRNETFGPGKIILRNEPKAIVVPTSAVQTDGDCQIVFVRERNYFKDKQAPKLFQVREVRVGVKQDGFTEIIAGLLPGEVVVTDGASVLRSQLLINDLGAGCCAHGH